jgi:hypothetical protein
MKVANKDTAIDKRINERSPYSGHIFFASKDGFNEGRLKDYSKSGLFIITKARLSVGEIITVAIPYVNDKQIKCKGQIMRKDRDGYGIDLFKNRKTVNLRIIK